MQSWLTVATKWILFSCPASSRSACYRGLIKLAACKPNVGRQKAGNVASLLLSRPVRVIELSRRHLRWTSKVNMVDQTATLPEVNKKVGMARSVSEIVNL